MRINCGLKVRHFQVLLIFFAFCSCYIMRVNLSIGIVQMTNLNSTSSAKVFNWTVTQQAATQSAFFVGYFLTNLASSVLVNKFNNKYLLLSNILSSSVITLLIPVFVTAGEYYALIIIRFFLGITLGCVTACIMGILSRWIPQSEKSRCGAFTLGGLNLGSLISLSVSGWVGSNYGGWPATFYFSGTVGTMWSILWIFFGADSPETCSFISMEEEAFICSHRSKTASPKNIPVPWKNIFLSIPCWAMVLSSVAYSWGFWTLLTAIPTFFENILHLSVTMNGILTAIPFACMWIMSFPSSYISDLILGKRIISTTSSRKLFNSIGQFGAAVCLVIFTITPNEEALITMYILGTTLLSFSDVGCNINQLDILPNFAGSLTGLSNGLANAGAATASMFVGIIVHDAKNPDEWKVLFLIAAAVLAFGNTLFLILGSSEELDFNKISTDIEETTTTSKGVECCSEDNKSLDVI